MLVTITDDFKAVSEIGTAFFSYGYWCSHDKGNLALALTRAKIVPVKACEIDLIMF